MSGGGWTQNDEATTHFTAIIDDLTLGFKFIKENFGNFYYIIICIRKLTSIIMMLMAALIYNLENAKKHYLAKSSENDRLLILMKIL